MGLTAPRPAPLQAGASWLPRTLLQLQQESPQLLWLLPSAPAEGFQGSPGPAVPPAAGSLPMAPLPYLLPETPQGATPGVEAQGAPRLSVRACPFFFSDILCHLESVIFPLWVFSPAAGHLLCAKSVGASTMCQTICQAQSGDRVGREMGGGEENACSFKGFNNSVPTTAVCQAPTAHQVPFGA